MEKCHYTQQKINVKSKCYTRWVGWNSEHTPWLQTMEVKTIGGTFKSFNWCKSYIVLKALPYVTWFFLFEMPIDTYINNYESVNRVIERNGDSRKENNSLFQQSCSYNPLFGFLDQWKLFIWYVILGGLGGIPNTHHDCRRWKWKQSEELSNHLIDVVSIEWIIINAQSKNSLHNLQHEGGNYMAEAEEAEAEAEDLL
jgi:hypothetical protein